MPNEQGKNMKVWISVALALFLAGCASPKVAERSKPGDAQLACDTLQKEMDEAEKLRVAAENEWGTTGGVMVKTLIFFPATLVSYENVERAITAAEARKVQVAALMQQKNCKVAVKPDPRKKK